MATTKIKFPTTIAGTYSAPGFQIAPLSVPTPRDAALQNALAQLYTPAQLRNQANQQTNAQINAQLGASNASSKAEQAQYAALADRAAGLASALGSWGQQYGANDAAAYNQAANTVGQLGTGLTGAVASDWNSALAASKASVDKTLAGQGQVTSYDPGQLQSTAQYLGVTMPGTTLAQQAINGQKLGEFGAVADLAQVKAVSDNFIAQAQQALQQRAAERATIIAQRPELYQAALQAQRQDQIQTQNHIDQLVTASQTWLLNQAKLKQSQQQQDRAYRLSQEGITHVDPVTGKPVGEYVRVPAKGGGTAVVPWSTATSAGQNARALDQRAAAQKETIREYDKNFTLAQKTANAKAVAAKLPGKFDKDMSAAVHYISDSFGRPIVAKDGKPVPYTAASKTMSTIDRLKIQGTMSGYADTLAKGYTDPKTGATTPKVDLTTAISNFASRGYLSGTLAQWGIAALENSYGVTGDQIAMVMGGIDPTTGGALGALSGDYGPPSPSKNTLITQGGGKPLKTKSLTTTGKDIVRVAKGTPGAVWNGVNWVRGL